MILDAALQLSSSQAVTASAVSTNALDLLQARNVASGAGSDDALLIYITVEVAATAAGAATVNFQAITSAAANLSSPTIVSQSDAIPKASLTVGTQIFLPVARSFLQALGQRYLGLQYTVGTGPLTAGTFTAGFTLSAADSRAIYPVGYSIK